MKRPAQTATVLFIILFVLLFTRILGALTAPTFEQILTRIFGMPVSIDKLSFNPFSGKVHAEGIEFRNQPEFSYGPHMYVGTLDVTMDFKAFKDKHVKIDTAAFNRIYYMIERRNFENEKRTNVQTWVRHIKKWYKERHPESDEDDDTETSWKVSIDHIVIHNGTFIYDDRTQGDVESRFVFHKLKGKLSGFRYPSKPQTRLEQELEISGYIGAEHPAPVEVSGNANFSGGDVSFDLTGKIRGGYMGTYSRFWKELPITVKKGNFNLDIRMICTRGNVRSRAHLHFYKLKVNPGPTVTEKVWGLPVSSVLTFMQKNRELRLHVPVSGDIEDPQFDFYRAFEKAFQRALKEKVVGSVTFVTMAPFKIVAQTKDVVVQTQETLTTGIEKIASIVTSPIQESKNDRTK